MIKLFLCPLAEGQEGSGNKAHRQKAENHLDPQRPGAELLNAVIFTVSHAQSHAIVAIDESVGGNSWELPVLEIAKVVKSSQL